jgi:hypothetical protein
MAMHGVMLGTGSGVQHCCVVKQGSLDAHLTQPCTINKESVQAHLKLLLYSWLARAVLKACCYVWIYQLTDSEHLVKDGIFLLQQVVM